MMSFVKLIAVRCKSVCFKTATSCGSKLWDLESLSIGEFLMWQPENVTRLCVCVHIYACIIVQIEMVGPCLS